MKKGGTRSISRIRTFDEDVARVRGVELPKAPKLKKEKASAQAIADTILKDEVRDATDYIGTTDGEMIEMLPTEVTQQQKKIDVKVLAPPAPFKPKAKPTPRVKPKSKVKVPEKLNPDDLATEVAQISNIQTKSVRSTEEAVYDASNNDLSGGTIITNKKRTKFRLFPAIAASVQSWFGETTTKINTPRKPQHTINKAESRIATITAAARASKHAPHSDHGVVVKRLTKTKRKKRSTEVSITKKEDVAAPQWGSSVEETIEAPEATPVTVEKKLIDLAPAATVEVGPKAVSITTITEETPNTDTSKTFKKEERAEKKRLKKEKKELEKKKKNVQKKVPRKKRTYRATPEAVSGVPIYIYILVIAGASLLGIGVSVYWFMSSTPTEEAVVIRVPSLFASDAEVSVELSSTRETTLSTILDVSLTSRETIQIYPTVTDSTGFNVPAAPQEILNALGFSAPGSFTRAVTDITFGSYNGTDSFILIKATNFDTAFGGLLEWEPDMSADLSPLFGIPVTQSYDPYARTDTQVRSAFFRDTIISNKSVRLLVDAQDNERLMYAFVTPNIILITPNSDTFKAVLPLVTQ